MNNPLTRPEDRPFYDVLLHIVGPILIMLMIGSLIFFLIEVFYRGPHDGRLRWVFGLFTLATVLVSRISIEEGMERAALFGFALAVATLITSMTLVEFDYGPLYALEPVVLMLFITVVMWSANRLTWDCTLIDDSRDVSAIGLTELLSRKLSGSDRQAHRPANADSNALQDSELSGDANASSRLLFLFFAGSKTKNTPGLWVLYFSLAAFPVFGIGQWFAARDPELGSFWIFLLFAVYLGSGLGLLMLTSLLGLERYLHRRGTAMPHQVSRNWLLVGTAFALAVMLSVLFLPKPNLSGRLQRSIEMLTSPIRDPSKVAVGNDGQLEGDKARGAKPNDQGRQASASNQGKPNKEQDDSKADDSKADDSSAKHTKADAGNVDSNENGGRGVKGKQSEENSPRNEQNPSQSKQRPTKQDRSQSESNATQNDRNQKQPSGQNSASNRKQQERNDDRRQPNQAKRPELGQNQAIQNRPRPNNPSHSNSRSVVAKFLEAISKSARFLTYLIGLVIILVLAWMFRDELAKLWYQLFGRKRSKEDVESEATEIAGQPVTELPRFGAFPDPFASGHVRNWTAQQTIEYTFNALEAWARESGLARAADDTPYDFALEIAGFDEALGGEAKRLAELHGRCLYGDQKIGISEVSKLTRLWKLMNSTMAQSAVSKI